MPKYLITVREARTVTYEIEANSKSEAREKWLIEGAGDPVSDVTDDGEIDDISETE